MQFRFAVSVGATALGIGAVRADAVSRFFSGGPSGVGTSWNDAGNWDPAGVPGGGDVLTIALDLNVNYDYPGNITLGALTLNRSNFGAGTGISGTAILTMSANTLRANSQLLGDNTNGGFRGRGRIDQSGGSNTAGVLSLGKLASNTGTYNLSGTGVLTSSDARVGDAGAGTFTQSGGTHNAISLVIGNLAGGVGTYNVSGGALRGTAADPVDMIVGNSGTGTLNISNGAAVVDDVWTVELGNNAGSVGQATVSSGSQLRMYELAVGGLGSGTLNVTSGSTVVNTRTSVGADVGGAGTINVNGAGSRLEINAYQLPSGGLTGGWLLTGGYGGTATLNVTGGGQVSAREASFDSMSTVLVDGAGSMLHTSLWTSVGPNATLEVKNGGSVVAASSFVGEGLAIDGTVTVGGNGSTMNSRWIFVSAGTMNVIGGATVTSNSSTSSSGVGGEGESGTAVIDGVGSQWNTAGLRVGVGSGTEPGSGATGSVSITGGGAINSTNVIIGSGHPFAFGNGTVSVSGAGSAWTISSTLAFGSKANGTLNITDGGRVSVGGAITDGGAGTSTITLDGGTLDLQGHAIGDSSSTPLFDILNFRSGVLKNVAEINDGGPVTKTTAGTLVLDGTNTYSGVTTVSEGTLVFNTSYTSGAGLDIASGAVARVAAGGDRLLKTGSLTIADGGRLEMNDNDFIVDYAEAGPSPEFTLRDKVKAFRDNANATSGISFTRGANDRVIAVAEKSEWSTTRTEFSGVPVDNTTIIGKHTYYGDANLDGKVDSNDYVAVDVGLGTGDSWVQGDFNFSGSVTSDDYVAIDTNLGKGVTNGDPLAIAELKAEMIALHSAMFGDEYVQKLAIAEAHGYAALVPEPSLLGFSSLALLTGRRRRRRNI